MSCKLGYRLFLHTILCQCYLPKRLNTRDEKMKRKTLYNFNNVQLTFNQCVFNRIQHRTEHYLYSTRLDKVDRIKSSTRSVQFNTAWRIETQHRLDIMKSCSFHFPLLTFQGMKKVETIRAFEYSCRRASVGLSDDLGR